MHSFYKVMTKWFDSKKACYNIYSIHSFDKWISYDKFSLGADYCERAMLEMGLSDVEKKELKADGKTLYGEHLHRRAWNVRSAVLTDEKGNVLCDYKKTPCSLCMYSAPTEKGGITAGLAVIDDLNDYSDVNNLKGRILLVNCPSSAAVDFALKVGAVGILCDFFPMFEGIRDTREQMSGANRWDCLNDESCSLFGFSLTPEQGDILRQRSKEGEVVLHADVDSEFADGALYVISGSIDGTEPDSAEIILYGHLNEPGANDNASGCGGLLELFRSMKLAIDAGELPRPKNTLRLVMGPEYFGSVGYIHYHPERERLCLISADMVGSEKTDKARMSVCLNPLSNRSYLDGAIALAKQIYNEYTGEKMELKEIPFWKMSDNFVADPSLNTPSVCLGNFPTESYHSSMDTMDRIDSDILKRNILVAGCCAYMLSVADEEICNGIANQLKRQMDELTLSSATEWQKLFYNECLNCSLRSLRRILKTYNVNTDCQGLRVEMPPYAKKYGGMVPVRIIKGPLFFSSVPEIKNEPAIKINTTTPLNWTDGVRTLWDITLCTALENKTDSDLEIEELFFKHLKMYECLKKYGYVTIIQ